MPRQTLFIRGEVMHGKVSSPGSQRRHSGPLKGGHGLVLPGYHHAVRAARTLFPSRVFAPDEVGRVLKDGHQSRKIGKIVAKGHRRGWPIFTLTLEERATCPRTCGEWQTCYGNRMQAAERIEPGAALMAAITTEVRALADENPTGFLIRLHILGDFFSVDYVAMWSALLADVPALHLFGFTAQPADGAIGSAVGAMMQTHGWDRAAFRFSGAPGPDRASRVIGPGEHDAAAIVCPAQTGGTDCCATCALCWGSERSIAFRRH